MKENDIRREYRSKLLEFQEQLNNDCEITFLQTLFDEIFHKDLKELTKVGR